MCQTDKSQQPEKTAEEFSILIFQEFSDNTCIKT